MVAMPRSSDGLVHVEQHHGDIDVDERHRDAAAHGAGADDAAALDLARLVGRRDARHVGHGALGEEQVAHGLGFRRAQRAVADGAFHGEALLEGQLPRGAHGGDVQFGRDHALVLLGGLRAEGGDLRLGEWRDLVVAHAARALALGHQALRVGNGRGAQVAFGDLVDQAQLLGFLGAHRAAIEEHRQRLLGADDARQALRAHRAGHDAQRDLGESQLRALVGDAVVAGQRHFDATTQRGAVQRHHDGLRQGFELGEHVAQFGRRHHAAEFADVGASHEGASRADQHHGARIAIGGQFAGD